MSVGNDPPKWGGLGQKGARWDQGGAPCPTHIFTSQDFSWLQKGQVNWVSKVPVIFFLGGGFRLDFLRPMSVGGQTWSGSGGDRSQQLRGPTEPSSSMLLAAGCGTGPG